MKRPAPGFAYLMVLLIVAGIGVALARVMDGWHDGVRREKETQLLFAGRQIRSAIIHYYEHAPAQAPKFPTSLADLLRDPREPGTVRHLREIYRDPMTGGTDWGLVKTVNGEIVGVYSQSTGVPLKQANFALAERRFVGAHDYHDWVFVFTPGRFTALAPQAPAQ
jgi:type II secretory pathway pseudopilin PulG